MFILAKETMAVIEAAVGVFKKLSVLNDKEKEVYSLFPFLTFLSSFFKLSKCFTP